MARDKYSYPKGQSNNHKVGKTPSSRFERTSSRVSRGMQNQSSARFSQSSGRYRSYSEATSDARDNPPTQPIPRQKSNQTSFKGKLAERGCFICGADDQLVGDGHLCSNKYKNVNGQRSERGQLYYEKYQKSMKDMSISYVLQVEKEKNDSQPQSFHMLCDDSNSEPKLLTNVEAQLVSHIPHTINSQAEHAMKPTVNVLLDSGNRCRHNLVSSDAIKRLELKAVKRSPLNLRTFNNTEAENDEEVTIRLSLPILRQDKEVYTCSYEFTCLVVQNLSVDVLISEKSI